jgi:glyoxylase-like metal-dependent hydrolase (beta-lactamase superfamily II)
MQFLTLDRADFVYGAAMPIAPSVRRVIAENPSKFTYHGTGTYIVGGGATGRGDVAVIDPGPRLDSHRDALAAALVGCTVRAILVTHCHADHSPLAAWLAAETGAPTVAFGPHGDDTWDIGEDPPEVVAAEEREAAQRRTAAGADDDAAEPVIEESTDREFCPDIAVGTGDQVAAGDGWVITALHTPGHTSNHTCFTLDDGTTRTIFTGDHVMGVEHHRRVTARRRHDRISRVAARGRWSLRRRGDPDARAADPRPCRLRVAADRTSRAARTAGARRSPVRTRHDPRDRRVVVRRRSPGAVQAGPPQCARTPGEARRRWSDRSGGIGDSTSRCRLPGRLSAASLRVAVRGRTGLGHQLLALMS